MGMAIAQPLQISGTVLDSTSGKPIADASVVLRDTIGVIYAFAFTNASGTFSLEASPDTPAEQVYILVSIFGYASSTVPFRSGKKSYRILLKPLQEELPEVIVRDRKPVVVKNDTISYDVKRFAQAEDRSIGDVIRRLPGVTVNEDGSITYNGRSISNLFIQGDDLMDGRYGGATKVIQKDQISSIEILLNHQPIHVLRGKLNSDDVAINLTLRDPKKVKMSGTAMVGGGIPAQYDGHVGTILLNQRIKMLNNFKTNNSGITYQNEITQYNRDNFLSQKNTGNAKGLLSSALANEPDIPREYYFLNQSNLLNVNNLYKTADSLQVSFNVNALFDRNRYQFESQVNNLLAANDTVVFNELQEADRRLHLINGAIAIQANKNNTFLSNKLRLMFSDATENSTLVFNQDSFPQRLSTAYREVSNDFTFIPKVQSKNLLKIDWYGHYRRLPETLNVFSGIVEQTLNNGLPYRTVEQTLRLPTYFSNASVSYFIINQSRLRQLYELKLISEKKELQSAITLQQLDGTKTFYSGDGGNHISWNRNLLQASAEYVYQKDAWQASLSLPFIAQTIAFQQRELPEIAPNRRVLLNPKFNVNFYINPEDMVSFQYRYSNRFGDIRNIYQGLMLRNFRFLSLNTPVLQEFRNSSIELRYDFRRAIKMLVASAQIQYDRITANTQLGSIFSNNIQQSILLPIPNNQNVLSATGQLSKYFFKYKTKASLLTSWSKNFDNQVINNQSLQFSNNAFVSNFTIEGTFSGKFAYQYSGGFLHNKSFERNANSSSINNTFMRLEQSLSLGYHFDQIFVNIRGRQIAARQSKLEGVSFFASDASLRYRFNKLNAEFSLDITNLFNQREYVIFAVSSNQFNITKYPLRSRMVIGRFTFHF